LEKPQKHMQCWDKSRVPQRLAYGSNPRVPQLLCLADVGWRITTTEALAKRKGKVTLGEHGYDNADPHMRALFIAHGPAFKQGIRVKEFPNVDVYPLMAHLLQVPAAPNDGDYDAVKDMLKP
jgi:predicted AlkP superfamily pyrophosphatase or phosphodiesterase